MHYRHLNLILGDQLTFDSALFDAVDKQQDLLWMAEVLAESIAIPSSKQRTVLFLSAMRHFAEQLKTQGYTLHYRPLTEKQADFAAALGAELKQHSYQKVRCVLPGDYRVVKLIEHTCEQQAIPLEWLQDRHFIAQRGEFSHWMTDRKQPRMEYWYRELRKSRNILMQADGKPEGGQWNFDKDNRKAFAKSGPKEVPEPLLFKPDKLTEQVIRDVNSCCPELAGELPNFHWPVTREQALQTLQQFIDQRLPLFGDYQDAMWTAEPWLYHSHLSTSLNLKMISPMEVIDAAVDAYRNNQAPLNAVEGFIRQILGWREYIRGLYWHYREDWSAMNALDAQQDLPTLYWDANTEMTCLHHSVKQVLELGYGHHIQRLMVTGLFALLYGVKPEQVHSWYLAMYADAVAWVEIPNTLGMSQYADGGIVGSKPYIASGAYIDRMSNYCKNCPFDPKQASGETACPFTTLYWSFVDQHQHRLSQNPRLGMQVKNWQRKSDTEQQAIRQRAASLFKQLP